MDGEALRLEVGEDGVSRLVFDRPGSPVNLLTRAVMERLDTLLGEAERLAGAGRVRALVVASAKPGSFLAGADVREMQEVGDAAEAAATARWGQRILRRLEELPVPTLAAIDGVCLGAGVELTLACGYRLAADSPATRIGFPEVQLGIIPALGGTVRLPRLVGARAALELVLDGERVDAREARRLGLVDAVFPPEAFEAEVLRFARERIERGRTRTGARRGVGKRLLEDTAPGRRLLFARVGRELAREEGERSHAARRALEAVADGVALPLERAFEREAEVAGELMVTREARGLLHALRLRQAAGEGRPLPAPAPQVERVAVLGAGRMGAGIAHLLARSGTPVRLREVRHPALLRGVEYIRSLFRAEVARGTLPRREAEERAPLVSGTLGFGGFGIVDLVIEAVGEDPEAKRNALREVEEHVREDCLLAPCGAAIPVALLQEAVARPARVVGMHFFHPVGRIPLVEVVRGPRTSAEAVAAALALARRAGKVPLVVRDGPGFLVNRILFAYLSEALRLVEEGAPPERVDAALTEFGMPLGPLRLMDELGVGFTARVLRLLAEGLGERYRASPVLEHLARAGRPGREWGAGFYRYEEGKDPRPDPRAPAAYRDAVRPREGGIPPDEPLSRTLLAMVNEAARALEEGVVERAAEVDLAMTLAAGFPRFRGGLLYHADRTGVPEVVGALEEHALRFGERFSPAALLVRLAEEGGMLYGTRAPASGHGAGAVLE